MLFMFEKCIGGKEEESRIIVLRVIHNLRWQDEGLGFTKLFKIAFSETQL